jgi:hypothetical protein
MTTNNQINTLMTATPTANASSLWDGNKNLSANNHLAGYATTSTAAGTTTLVVGSAWQQFFTGSTTQIVVMPVTSTLVLGQSFYIVNNSTGNVTVNSSGGNAIQVMGASTTLLITCISTSGTTAASWSIEYVGASSGGTVSNGTINDLAYYAATGTTVSPLATANSGYLVTSAGGVPSISSTGPAITLPSVTFNSTSGIIGTTTNDSAAAGSVGEYVTSGASFVTGNMTTSNTPQNLTSISLTAGDWDVWSSAVLVLNIATTTAWTGGISTTSATAPSGGLTSAWYWIFAGVNGASYDGKCYTRLSLSTTTTVYLVGTSTWTTTAPTFYCQLNARRAR